MVMINKDNDCVLLHYNIQDSVQLLLLAQPAENADQVARQVVGHHLLVHTNL